MSLQKMKPHQFKQYVRDNNITHYSIASHLHPIKDLIENMDSAINWCKDDYISVWRNDHYCCDIEIINNL